MTADIRHQPRNLDGRTEAVLRKRSLSDELVPLIRDMIVGGELAPGAKIPEQAIAERFGVSRTPLREALKALAAEGIVTLHTNRGATVATISAEQVGELFPIMGALEALAGELACQRASDADIRRIRQMHERMQTHYRRRERGPYIKLNQAIHEALFEIAGNETLTQMYRALMLRIHSIRYIARKSPDRWREAMDDHEAIVEALEQRSGKRLARVLAEHLAHKAEMVREALSAQD
ncbi:MAG: GntR family transcriptional regulator [Proteobacteria bacterium]|nr:GntR family transcriptional regulator [Pseudomonadota bacterium]